jgi:aryl-alcohol dehydrogenase-like predicted oxidoreductase
VATKVRNQTGPGPNDVGLSRKHIMVNVEHSLKALQTPFIDLYQVHIWDNRTDIYDVMRTLNDLVRVGKVRNIGFSNFTSWQAQKALDYAKTMGLEPFVSNQSQYSLMCRTAELDLIPQCLDSNLAFLPWSPLAGGWLSGKFRRGIREPPKDSRVAWAEAVGWDATSFKSKAQDQTFDIIEELYKIGDELKATPAQVALRWLVQKPGVTSVIIGAKSVQQLNDNVQAAFIKLTDAQMDRLNKVSKVPITYPHGMIDGLSR